MEGNSSTQRVRFFYVYLSIHEMLVRKFYQILAIFFIENAFFPTKILVHLFLKNSIFFLEIGQCDREHINKDNFFF